MAQRDIRDMQELRVGFFELCTLLHGCGSDPYMKAEDKEVLFVAVS